MALENEFVDGRHARRAVNRESVLAAMESLWREGNYDPSTADVAERAGLSSRSLFRYFDDVDDLTRSAMARLLDRYLPLARVEIGPERPTAEKVAALCDMFDRLYDTAGVAAHAARVTLHRSPLVAARVEEARTQVRRGITTLFAPELAHCVPGTLDVVATLMSFEVWELLHQGSARDQQTARRGLEHALIAVLTKETP
jgi:AcrR family transcriptional regulator